jgi:acetyl esterase/lipase
MKVPRISPLVLLLFLPYFPFAAAQTPQPAQPTHSDDPRVSIVPDVTYATVAGHPLLLDIYQPTETSSAPRPAIILIHGGGWSSLDKSTMRTMGMFLARSGFVAFSVDYRLFSVDKDKDKVENPWPAQLDDVQRAVRWIRANAAKYQVDPNHIGAFGHSAGAQLAALLGLESTRDNSDAALASYSSTVQAVVDYAGPTDFTAHRDADDEFPSMFLGGDYSHHADLWQQASPVFHVSKDAAPFLIIHGVQDDHVPIVHAQEFADKLKRAGAQVKFVKVDDGHTFSQPENRRQLAIETLEFFTQYLRSPSPK